MTGRLAMASLKGSYGEEADTDQRPRKRRKKLGHALCTCSSSSSSTQVQLLHRPVSEECIQDLRDDDYPFDRCESESSVRSRNGNVLRNGAACRHRGAPKSYPHLPLDLVISGIVALRLPLLDLIRARAVCRSWRDSIFSPSFADSFAANADLARPRLLVEHSSPSGPCLAAFDLCSKYWAVVPTPASFRHLVAASMGLFCFTTGTERPPSLVVGNPVTNKWKPLPAIPLCVPAHGPILVAMVANCKEASYKVSVLFGMWDDDATDAYLPFMYDSVSDKWQERKSISARLSFATSRSVVKTPDILLSVDSNAGSLLSYDMTGNVGHMIQLENSPTLINEQDPKTNLWRRLPQIAVCDGVLYLVARCVGQKAPECKLGQLPIVQHSPVGVWKMRDNSEKWDFITSIPFDLLEMIVRGSDGTDFIVASNGHNELFFVLKGSPHMLALDPSSQTWTVLPGCPTEYNLYPLHQSVFVEPLFWLPAQ